MMTLAQHGFGPKDKIIRGMKKDLLSGAILSPRYLNPEKMRDQINSLEEYDGRLLIDPEFYAAKYLSHPSANLGNLEMWDYFKMPRRPSLISGVAIPGVIRNVITTQKKLGLKEWIAPNVYIQAADSIETAISLSFISQTKEIASECGGCPVFATLAIDRNAVMSKDVFQDILDALTAIETPPDGYYILIGSQISRDAGPQVRSDIYHSQVVAGWMYLNYALSINGARVVNGYCHLLSPLLGICGAEATANGWFSGLRHFSMNKYLKEVSGGKSPIIRYVSNALLSRIKQTDYIAFKAILPNVANGGKYDDIYENEEPSRTDEALQSWEAISAICNKFCLGNIDQDLRIFDAYVDQASQMWAELYEAGFSQEIEPNMERLESIQEGIKLFKEWAEID